MRGPQPLDPAGTGAPVPAGGDASDASAQGALPRVVRLHRASEGPIADDGAHAVADALLAATDDDPELEAAPAARPLRRRFDLGRLVRPRSDAWAPPVTGALAAIFGIAALFKAPLVLAPLAIGLALVAGFRGHHGWAVIGLGTALAGLFTSAWFWALLGLAWLYQSWG